MTKRILGIALIVAVGTFMSAGVASAGPLASSWGAQTVQAQHHQGVVNAGFKYKHARSHRKHGHRFGVRERSRFGGFNRYGGHNHTKLRKQHRNHHENHRQRHAHDRTNKKVIVGPFVFFK